MGTAKPSTAVTAVEGPINSTGAADLNVPVGVIPQDTVPE